MMIILGKFSKRHYRRQITTYLLACCLFLSLLPSVAVPGPKGKALGHSNLHGNGPFPTTHGRVNPAGIVIGSGGVKINGIAAGIKPGNTSSQSGISAFGQANNPVNPASNKVFLAQPGSNIVLILNSQTNHITGNGNKVKVTGGKNLVLAAGDNFSMAIPSIGSLSASLIVPDPIGAKGPNPTHGGSHPKKGDGNPGGGNGNGHWGDGNQGIGIGNSFTGNQGRGVGEGMAFGNKPEPPEPPDPPDPPEPPEPFVGAAPLPEEPEFIIGQCPALMELVARELGVQGDNLQIHLENTLADTENIQSCDMYARLVISAAVLSDPERTCLAALAKVVSEFASPATPISEEMLASIRQELKIRRSPEDKPHYTLAGQWLDALAEYFGILTTEIGWSVDESVIFVADKYVVPAIEDDDMSLVMFLQLQLEALAGS